MTVAELLSNLFNLGQRTDFWNSMRAARDFWMLVALGTACAVVAMVAYHAAHHHVHRLRH
jgi:hypothetical protein